MSDTYHRMCSTPLIQGQWKEPKVGDWFVVKTLVDKGSEWGFKYSPPVFWTDRYYIKIQGGVAYGERGSGPDVIFLEDKYFCHRRDAIYHPTQEDLQRMLPKECKWQLTYLGVGSYEIRRVSGYYEFQAIGQPYFIGDTAREALIQGVMHRHGLRWDGSEWRSK